MGLSTLGLLVKVFILASRTLGTVDMREHLLLTCDTHPVDVYRTKMGGMSGELAAREHRHKAAKFHPVIDGACGRRTGLSLG